MDFGLLNTKSYQNIKFTPTFFDDENFVTALCIGDDPHLDSDYYIRWGTPRTTSSAVVDSLKLFLPDSFV